VRKNNIFKITDIVNYCSPFLPSQ